VLQTVSNLELLHRSAHAARRKMRIVFFRQGDAMMTEQIANDSHIDATLCQMGSEGMPIIPMSELSA